MGGRLCAVLALGLLVAAGPARSEPPLDQRLDAVLGDRGLRGARIAALVVDASDGRVLYARDPDRALVPASNLKILTALATLSAFGPAHRFETHVFADAAPDVEGAVGRLYVVGGGDPALTSEDLWRLAADLRRAGLRRVRDAIILETSLFDDERWHPSWGRVSARAYNAPVGALTVNYGAFAARVRPGARSGEPVEVSLDPPVSFLRLTNRAQTLSARGRDTLVVDRRPSGAFEEVLVEGGMPAGAEAETYYRSVADPARYAGSVLRLQLEANGVVVEGESRRGSLVPDATPLLHFEGRPLADIVRLFMKFSNNAIGEGLVKAMAVRAGSIPGGWRAGIDAVREELTGLGLSVEGVRFVDGSGLSYANRVPPRAFVEALRLAQHSFRFGPEFVSALPIAAVDGTLEERAEEAAYGVRAKTGSLTRVTGLSGYARLSDGRRAVFSLLVNGFRGSTEAAWAGGDRFVAELVSGEGPRLAQDLRPPS
jgi:D-alanyl-D-alanine carboxypeptidase/D-alanyl-D-alanine-endopeptidase (penicillin-binding protein 4)